jgi:hypothetical protein
VLSRLQRAFREQDLVSGRHGDEQVRGERLLARARQVGAELVGHSAGTLLVDVPEHDAATTSQERLCRGPAVDARADHRRSLTVLAAERLGGEHGCGSRPQCRYGAGVERRAQ